MFLWIEKPVAIGAPTIKVLPKQDPERTMRAVEFHGKVSKLLLVSFKFLFKHVMESAFN